ncbi:TetR/AcrR family transcriptional regulator [Oceanotoga sp. DSM 15011]|uniref:TetR/AcrR family transcriptional regulator n=1 Tax=Oceanotoga sp. DSM 15011 TaxID=2984951 RepID=UPI0021F3D965|nr:TetR/AcrR family transcriptional regulator [Oceanotoga sp. DSM 15011]UYP01222.1 TetR/AcrR family transcriptional regulator [Oceanotoga sp. DSM 15011]
MIFISRNKYPEKTIENILDVALELFIKKGYENTSIQEIVNNLDGLSKGAIYYHFKSKEDILNSVAEKIYSSTNTIMMDIKNDSNLNGLEKLKKMFSISLKNPNQNKMFSVAPKLLNNPNILALQMKEIIENTAPNYIKPIIEEGIKDGSIKTNYPKELSEIMILISNIWLNPLVYKNTNEEMLNKIKFYDYLLKQINIDIFDQTMYDQIVKLNELSNK